MPFFYQFLYAYPILSLAQTAFTLWMLVDSYRRQADLYWFWLILILQPVGPWVYFFVVKIRDFRGGTSHSFGWSLWHPRPSLDELRYRVEQTPTPASHLEYAERLIERGDYADAVPHLDSALLRDTDHCQGLYFLALCQVELGQPGRALYLLEKIIARDRAWSNYLAWHLLIRAQTATGDHAGALAKCHELARLSPTLEHKCLLAEHLVKEGQNQEAHQVLEKGLDDYHYASGHSRRRNRRWATKARRLQKQIARS